MILVLEGVALWALSYNHVPALLYTYFLNEHKIEVKEKYALMHII